jgi:hypothetical protein
MVVVHSFPMTRFAKKMVNRKRPLNAEDVLNTKPLLILGLRCLIRMVCYDTVDCCISILFPIIPIYRI